jgi:hypothetical protein
VGSAPAGSPWAVPVVAVRAPRAPDHACRVLRRPVPWNQRDTLDLRSAGEAPSPTDKAARRLCRAALPWARYFLPPCGAITSFLSKLKPAAIATSVTNYFRWVSPQRGALGFPSFFQGSPGTGSSSRGAEGSPVPTDSTRDRCLSSGPVRVPGQGSGSCGRRCNTRGGPGAALLVLAATSGVNCHATENAIRSWRPQG